MVVSCLTVYVIAFSSVILVGRSYATTTLVPVRQNYRRGAKINFYNPSKTNTSTDIAEPSKTYQKFTESHGKHFERAKALQSSPVSLNESSAKKLASNTDRHANATLSYFALFDPVNNVTKKLKVPGENMPSIIRYKDFYSLSQAAGSERKSGENSDKKFTSKGIKSENRGKIQNFVEWDILRDAENEVRIHYNGITAKETVVKTGVDEETGKRQGLKLRQLTDGTHFIQLIYNFENEIQDCEYIKQKAVIQKFLKSFRDNVENAKSVYYENENEKSRNELGLDEEDEAELEEDEGKIENYSLDEDLEQYEGEDLNFEKEYRNVTFQVFRSDESLPGELAEWMNYSALKRKCRENHKMLKQLAFDKRYGDELAKKLAEEHIERRKRDIMDVLLVPGTKWCGKGRRATKYTSLGGFSRTDKCCRVHDTMCPHWIGSLEEKYELFNWRINTIMHCRCDKRFRACLKMAKTGTANFVGKLFFNVVQTKCFVLKPQEVCLKYSWWGKCEKKEYRKKAYLKDNLSY